MTPNGNNFDEYSLDTEAIINESKKKPGQNFPKVNWLQLPKGDSMSTWRIYPCLAISSFFVKVFKHWNIPGLGKNPGQDGTLNCPRSFVNPETNERFPCAICEKYWQLKKGDEDDNRIAEALKARDQFYVNAESVDNPSLGMGVLSVPYTIHTKLLDLLGVPHTKDFTHPIRGRNITIKTETTDAIVPGSGSKKRDYNIIVGDRSEVPDINSMKKVYNLKEIFGVPSYEFTQMAVARMIQSDPEAGSNFLPEGTPKWISLNSSNDRVEERELPRSDTNGYNEDPSFDPSTFESHKPNPIAVEPTQNVFTGVQTTALGADGKPVCFGKVFDIRSAVCVSCSSLGNCASEIARQSTPRPATQAETTSVPPISSPRLTRPEAVDIPPSDDMEAEMLAILGKKTF